MMDALPSVGGVTRRLTPRRVLGAGLGLIMLAAATWVVVAQRETLWSAAAEVEHVPAWLVAVLLALPIANWFVVSCSLWLLTGMYGRVGLGEMSGLTANAWLLNYLPLRPGMVGRLTYHRTVNGILLRDSAKVLMMTTGGSALAAVVLLGVALGVHRAPEWSRLPILVLPACVACLLGVCLADRSGRMLAAWSLRYVDVLIWTARYVLVFSFAGVSLSIPAAAAIAGISQLALLVPITGNGLGVREWAVGLTAAFLPSPALAGDGAVVGLAADLVNRAAEVVVSIPIGLVGASWLTKRLRRSRR